MVCRKIEDRYLGKPVERRVETAGSGCFIATFAGLIFHYIGIGPNKEWTMTRREIMSKSKMIVRTKLLIAPVTGPW